MNILHLTKRYPNAIGGDAIVVSNLARYQKADGHRVFVLTSNCADIDNREGVKKFGLPINNIAIDVISIGRIITLLGLVFYSFWYLRRIRPNVIHSHTMDFGFAVSLAARVYRIPIINTCHSVSFTSMRYSTFKRNLEIWLLRHAHYHAITTVDSSTIEPLHQAGLKNITYLPNAVEASNFKHHRKRPKDAPLRILYVGRLVSEKGLPYLLDALAELADYGALFELRVVGEGDMLKACQAQAEKLGIRDSVSFLGRRSQKRLQVLYAEADAFVLPSLHEAFGLVVLEAWAASLPAVVTRIGSMTKLCKDGQNALVVQPRDSHAIAQALLRIYNDQELAEQLGSAGRKLVEEKYTYRVLANAMGTIYKEVSL